MTILEKDYIHIMKYEKNKYFIHSYYLNNKKKIT